MKKNQNEFNNLIEFEFRYADDMMNRADALVGTTKYEFKSWTPGTSNPWNSFFDGSSSSFTQLIRYFENSTNINQIRYVFNGSKANEAQVKNAFKQLFSNSAKKQEIFAALNQEFRQNLGLSGLDAQTKLNILIEDTSSLLYSFIKIE